MMCTIRTWSSLPPSITFQRYKIRTTANYGVSPSKMIYKISMKVTKTCPVFIEFLSVALASIHEDQPWRFPSCGFASKLGQSPW